MADHNMELDCKRIHDCSGSLSHLIPSFSSLTHSQRQQLRDTYKALYGEDLIICLHRYESGLFSSSSTKCSVFSLWMLGPHHRDATLSKQALQQDDPDFKVILEIFVGRKSSHIALIKQAYHKIFTRQLDQDIINLDPPHPFQKVTFFACQISQFICLYRFEHTYLYGFWVILQILVALAASHQAHQVDISHHISKCDARRLYETGEGGSGAIEEPVVLEILSKRSIAQLKLTFLSYKHIYGHDYTKVCIFIELICLHVFIFFYGFFKFALLCVSVAQEGKLWGI